MPGLGKRLAEARWGIAGRMALVWLVTLPAAGAAGAVAGPVGAALAAAIYLASRRDSVGPHNVAPVAS